MNLTMEEYLRPTPAIDCEARSIKQKAQSLTKGQEEIRDKAKCLFYFVRDEIKYNMYVPHYRLEHFLASTTLKRGKGFCIQKAVLLVALARAIGIPARLRFADIRNHLAPKKVIEQIKTDLFVYHGYTELYINGRWVKATPTFDVKTCQENQIIPVEFDGKKDAIFHSHNQEGKLHIEYIRDYGHYQDIPLDDILDAWLQTYGSVYIKWQR